jgi:hypothetical protein
MEKPMMRIGATLAVLVGLTVATVLGTATMAYASIGPNKAVGASLQSGTIMKFESDVDGLPITVTCNSFMARGKTGSEPGHRFDLSAPPTISGCTDSLGGTDIITTNDTSGAWTFSVNKTGTKVALTIPKAGATIRSRAESSCTITLAPTEAAAVRGTYNGSNTVTVSGSSVPTKGKGCTSTADKTSATMVLSPAPGRPPWG